MTDSFVPSSCKLAVVNGYVIDPANRRSDKSNIIVENGKIAEVSPGKPPQGLPIIDAGGNIVTPGFIDLHTHLREPGYMHKEDIESGSRAAAAGGFTTIFCMPNTDPVNDNIKVTDFIRRRSEDVGLVNIYPVGAISKGLEGKELSDHLKRGGRTPSKRGGTPSKCRGGPPWPPEGYLIAVSDDGSSVQNEELMRRAMELAKKLGLLVISHPEDFSLSRGGVMNEGPLAKGLGLAGIPSEAENDIIERDINLAKATGARLHIAHVSTARGIDLVRKAKKENVGVTCEVTPHHLMLTEEDVGRAYRTVPGGENPNMKMKPPLRTEDDRLALIEGLRNGTVDAIATDHAPHKIPSPHGGEGRVRGSKDFLAAPFGVIGMETALPICLKLVDQNMITMEQLIRLLTIGPAGVIFPSLEWRGLGRKTRPGSLTIGSPADITIFDPRADYKIDSKKFKSKSWNTPFDGWPVRGKVMYTIMGGKITYQA